ncbi:MAG: hypothetical protein FJW79_02955 [Actinobacteria bacterium]|nr:hypothetical protein [Actinomycetota bacterium]
MIVGAILTLALLSSGAAVGLTDWQQFGTGNAVGRDKYGNPSLTIQSTTKLNPKALRFVITAPSNPIKTYGSWSLTCWNQGSSDYTTASASFTAVPPITKTITELDVRKFNFCELRVHTYTVKTGSLKLSLQAKYP